jgi:hypothetical protein
MLGRVVKKAREEEIFSREDTPTEQRVEVAFLYHAVVRSSGSRLTNATIAQCPKLNTTLLELA